MRNKLLTLMCIAFAYMAFGQSPFGTKQSISTNTGAYPKVIESGKINNDAYADIVIGTFVGGTIEWYKNNGNGTFTLQALVTSSLPRVNGLAIADLDNDNDNDIIATSYSLGQVVWFKNNGSGSFGSAQVIASGLTSANSVKAGDLDGNNTIDVVVSSYGTNSVSWFSNTGSGSFGSARIVSDISNSGPLDFDLADYDNDNDLDVVVAYGLIDAIVLFDNALTQSGSASFGTYALVDTANYGLTEVRFGDVDNNGDLEIIRADQFANTAWYNKTGSGFTKTSFSTSNSSATTIGVADIDGDSRNGVIVGYASSASTDKVTWYKNSSASGEVTIDNSQNDIYGLTLNDFDNDGDVDMATISSSQNHLNWFKNTGSSTPCTDSDNDGVCDSVDQCPGFDDRIDTNGNGIPDGCESSTCTQQTTNFSINPLTHLGLGSSSTTINFPTNSENVSFTISNIDANSKGKASNQYNEKVLVTYKDGSGNSKTYSTYYGSSVSSANVSINGKVQSVTVALSDFSGGSSTATLSVNFSSVTYCGSAAPPPCPDSDGDGVCDANDQCPGFNDNIDNNNNGIPDGCESTCTTYTANFNKNPLTHARVGSSSSVVSFPAGSKNPTFNIYGLDAQVSGKPSNRYIEHVVVTYVDGAGTTKTQGTYSGADANTVAISISGTVSSISVSLSDELNSGTSVSVNFSAVSYCIGGSSSASQGSSKESSQGEIQAEKLSTNGDAEEGNLKIYPNPASKVLYIRSSKIVDDAYVSLFNTNGAQVRQYKLENVNNQTYDINIEGLATGLYILRVVDQNGDLLITERIVIK